MLPPVQLLHEISEDAEHWYGELRGRQLRRAAVRLRHAALLVAAMHLYDKEARSVYEPLRSFEPTWTGETRDQARRSIENFERNHVIYTQAQQSRGGLEEALRSRLADQSERDAYEAIKDCGDKFIDDFAYRIRKEKYQYDSPAFLDALMHGADASSLNTVIDHGKLMLESLGPLRESVLDRALTSLGTVEASFERRFGVPTPEWLTTLPIALGSSG